MKHFEHFNYFSEVLAFHTELRQPVYIAFITPDALRIYFYLISMKIFKGADLKIKDKCVYISSLLNPLLQYLSKFNRKAIKLQ